MIFEPVEPRRILGFKWQGLFIRRQTRSRTIYAKVIADDIITLENIGEELLYGASSDRTRRWSGTRCGRRSTTRSGSVRPLIRLAVGPREYDAIRETVALEGVEQAIDAARPSPISTASSRSGSGK